MRRFIKLSLLAFYRRFLPERPYHWILYAIGIITILFVTATTLVSNLSCLTNLADYESEQRG